MYTALKVSSATSATDESMLQSSTITIINQSNKIEAILWKLWSYFRKGFWREHLLHWRKCQEKDVYLERSPFFVFITDHWEGIFLSLFLFPFSFVGFFFFFSLSLKVTFTARVDGCNQLQAAQINCCTCKPVPASSVEHSFYSQRREIGTSRTWFILS